jgi:hypothetical protein
MVTFNEVMGMYGKIQTVSISTKIPQVSVTGSILNSLTGAWVIP